MNFWYSLVSKFGTRRARTRTAQLELVLAYKRVFTGTEPPSLSDKQMVLADLANAASWGKACPPSTTDRHLRYTEGARSLFSRVIAFLSLNYAEVEALREAVRQEAIADQHVSPIN